MKDSFDRNINYARISLTNICNLSCIYCSQSNDEKQNIPISFYKNLIDVLEQLGVEKIRFTGGEPLLNQNIIELIKYTGSKSNIKDICITTNGILLDKYIDILIESGLTRVNISLDTVNKDVFLKLTGKDLLDKVIDNIKLVKNKGLEVKINSVLLKSLTDCDLDEFLEFGYENNIEIRFIELMPIGNNLQYYNDMFLSSIEVVNRLDCQKLDIKKNDVVTYYRYKNKYKFGIISAISDHFCSRCNRIRITSEGKLRLCLHSDKEIDLLEFSNDKVKLFEKISEYVIKKPEKHAINEMVYAKSNMVKIGG